MRITAKTEYACIAVLALAAAYGAEAPVRVRKMARDNGIPPRFLVQILLQLKGAGLVGSVRGAAGGYRLLKPPAEITLAAVMQAVDGGSPLASSADTSSPTACVLMDLWRDIAQRERRLLESTTFADLLVRVQARGAPMYYI